MHILRYSISYTKTLNSTGCKEKSFLHSIGHSNYIAWSPMEEFIITVRSLMVCVLLKLMTEALWLLVHLKFSLNFIIQLSLWPWINKLQVSYHEFILHLRRVESGMQSFFPLLLYPKKHTIKSKFKALSLMQNFWLLQNRSWLLLTHMHTFRCYFYSRSMHLTYITQLAGKTSLFTDTDRWRAHSKDFPSEAENM